MTKPRMAGVSLRRNCILDPAGSAYDAITMAHATAEGLAAAGAAIAHADNVARISEHDDRFVDRESVRAFVAECVAEA